MKDLTTTISTLLMIAEKESPNWREQAKTIIDTHLANYESNFDIRGKLIKAYTEANPGTLYSNAIQDMIVYPSE